MPEAEVALRLARTHPSLPGSGAMASIRESRFTLSPFLVFDIGRFMAGTGWEQVKEPQVGRNARTGAYRRGDKTIRVHSRPGEGDVITTINGRRIIAECKKGPLARRPGSQSIRSLTTALGAGAPVRRVRRRHRDRGRAGHSGLPWTRRGMAQTSAGPAGRHQNRPCVSRQCGLRPGPLTGKGASQQGVRDHRPMGSARLRKLSGSARRYSRPRATTR